MSAFAIDPREQQAVTPMHLIERAAASGASIEQMAQLFDLKLRVEADEARKAFGEAMARFKANPPRIVKNISKKAGQMDLHYASLDNVVETITPALSAVGIRHSWQMKQAEGWIHVTCVLSHDMGHTEAYTLGAPYDQSGGKNAIQAVASANTYLQRYTLLAATGMAATDTDDDGQAAGKASEAKMPSGLLDDHLSIIEAASTPEELRTAFTEAYKVAQKMGDKVAMADLIAAKDKRKGRFTHA